MVRALRDHRHVADRDFLPSSWGYFSPTWVDIATLIGSFGLFFTLFLLFCRFLPMIAMAEVKTVMPDADPHHGEDRHGTTTASAATRDRRPVADHVRDDPAPPSTGETDETPQLYGLLAEFDTPGDPEGGREGPRGRLPLVGLLHAVPRARLDGAMGIKPTILPVMVFFGGLTGSSRVDPAGLHQLDRCVDLGWSAGAGYQFLISRQAAASSCRRSFR